jgi:hypothetical protein
VPPSKAEAGGIDVLPYILLPLSGPEEFDIEVRGSGPAEMMTDGNV